MILVAFTTDLGLAYAQRQALATGVDSASLAIVRNERLKLIANPGLTCTDLRTADSSAASATALQQINFNAPFGQQLTTSQVNATLTCVGTNQGTLKATVSVAKDVKTVFGVVAGVSTLNIGRTSAAALGAVNQVSGYLPIGVCTNQAQAIVTNAKDRANAGQPNAYELILLDKVWKQGGDCGAGGAGNWGFLDCDGGNGAPDLADRITNGCKNPLILNSAGTFADTGTPGNKGTSGPVSTAMSTIMDKIKVLPVYSTVGGNGNNATYTIIGFLSVRVCGYTTQNKAEKGSCYKLKDPISNVDVARVPHLMSLSARGGREFDRSGRRCP
jgi:hypothetical protein